MVGPMKPQLFVVCASTVALLALSACGSGTPAAQTVSSTVTTTATVSVIGTVWKTLTPEPSGTVTVSVTPPAVTSTVLQTTTAQPAGPAVAFSDGTYLVGSEVEPGQYKASVTDSEGCYWKRMDDAGDIIDNSYEGSTLMVIADGDFAVEVDGCGSWSKVG